MSKVPDDDGGGILMPILVSLLVVVGIGTAGLFGLIGYIGHTSAQNQYESSSTGGTSQVWSQEPVQNQQNQSQDQNLQGSSGNIGNQPAPGDQMQNDPIQENKNTGNLGNYNVSIKEADIVDDYDGNKAIVITYTWENNSSETKRADLAISEKAFQDGVQLDTAMIADSSVYDFMSSTKEIRPGTSLDIQCAFSLSNTTSVVEFELSELFGDSKNVVSKNFDLVKLADTQPNNKSAPTAAKPQTGGTPSRSNGNWGEDSTTNEITGSLGRTVYWVNSGKSYHFTRDCPSLSRSTNIKSGTLQDALSAGKTDPCNNCAGGS